LILIDPVILAQYLVSGLMLAMIYALLALGFTLFFGVLDIIYFAHGDVFMVGAFAGLAGHVALTVAGVTDQTLHLTVMFVLAAVALSLLSVVFVQSVILLATMMLGTIMRESVRLFYPEGASPHKFPDLLPGGRFLVGGIPFRFDNCIMLAMGAATIVSVNLLINRTRLGLAIRAVAQDEETAKTMGINYTLVVIVTFALGSSLAAIAGIVSGLYYREISSSMGLMAGAMGFCAAIIGGLGNMYGAILGGIMIAALQTIGAVAMPFASAYKDVFMFAVVIFLIAWRPTGLIGEKMSDRV
jgi:branched-chain amino acid transport system permease protein